MLSSEDRRFLRSLRVQRPLGTGVARVMVPARFAYLFHSITVLGGSVSQTSWRDEVLRLARQQIGTEYFNRATPEDTPDRFSCSTLTTYVFALIGLELDRFAIDQSYQGIRRTMAQAQPGDLLFYRNRFPIKDHDREIGHVAILSENGLMIHGSSTAGNVVEELMIRQPP